MRKFFCKVFQSALAICQSELEEDREIRPDIEQVEKLVRSDELQQAVKQLIPDFD